VGLISWAKNLWSKLTRAFNVFIKEVFDAEAKLIIGQFKDLAIHIVADLATKDLSSEQKRAQAFKEIKETAITAGKDLSDTMINVLIELAVLRYKTVSPTLLPESTK
jgi:hypothetical protein